MKITLEKPELIQLIGKSLGYVIAEEDVTITAEPFEVNISNVNLQGSPKPTIPEPVFDEPVAQSTAESVLTMADILTQNASRGGPKVPRVVVEDDVPLSRPLGPQEYDEPPEVTQNEITALLRGGS